MGKKKTDDKPTKKKNRVGRAVTMWLRHDLFAALEQWRRTQTVKPSRTKTFDKALCAFLLEQGITVAPPPDDPD